MTTITLHPSGTPARLGLPVRHGLGVRVAVAAAALTTLGLAASTALGRTDVVEGPPASIEIYADMNREAALAPAAVAPAPETTTAPSSLDVLSKMNDQG